MLNVTMSGTEIADWSKTDWIVVTSVLLIGVAMAVYCLQFYCRPSSADASSYDDPLTDDSSEYLPPSASGEPWPSRNRCSKMPESRQRHLNPIGWTRPLDWESHPSKSEGDDRYLDENAQQPTPFFIDIPNEQFLQVLGKHDVPSS